MTKRSVILKLISALNVCSAILGAETYLKWWHERRVAFELLEFFKDVDSSHFQHNGIEFGFLAQPQCLTKSHLIQQ